jgi:hypothetical protein
MPPPQKEMKRQKFLSDLSGPSSGDEMPPPGVLVSSRVVPQTEVALPAPKQPSGSVAAKGKGATGTRRKATTRSRSKNASRAGSLRDGGGSGATDTCVAQGNPSGT